MAIKPIIEFTSEFPSTLRTPLFYEMPSGYSIKYKKIFYASSKSNYDDGRVSCIIIKDDDCVVKFNNGKLEFSTDNVIKSNSTTIGEFEYWYTTSSEACYKVYGTDFDILNNDDIVYMKKTPYYIEKINTPIFENSKTGFLIREMRPPSGRSYVKYIINRITGNRIYYSKDITKNIETGVEVEKNYTKESYIEYNSSRSGEIWLTDRRDLLKYDNSIYTSGGSDFSISAIGIPGQWNPTFLDATDGYTLRSSKSGYTCCQVGRKYYFANANSDLIEGDVVGNTFRCAYPGFSYTENGISYDSKNNKILNLDERTNICSIVNLTSNTHEVVNLNVSLPKWSVMIYHPIKDLHYIFTNSKVYTLRTGESTLSEVADTNIDCRKCYTFIFDNEIYLMGGYYDKNSMKFNPSTNSYERITPPSSVYLNSCYIFNSDSKKVDAIGKGQSYRSQYDLITKTWATIQERSPDANHGDFSLCYNNVYYFSYGSESARLGVYSYDYNISIIRSDITSSSLDNYKLIYNKWGYMFDKNHFMYNRQNDYTYISNPSYSPVLTNNNEAYCLFLNAHNEIVDFNFFEPRPNIFPSFETINESFQAKNLYIVYDSKWKLYNYSSGVGDLYEHNGTDWIFVKNETFDILGRCDKLQYCSEQSIVDEINKKSKQSYTTGYCFKIDSVDKEWDDKEIPKTYTGKYFVGCEINGIRTFFDIRNVNVTDSTFVYNYKYTISSTSEWVKSESTGTINIFSQFNLINLNNSYTNCQNLYYSIIKNSNDIKYLFRGTDNQRELPYPIPNVSKYELTGLYQSIFWSNGTWKLVSHNKSFSGNIEPLNTWEASDVSSTWSKVTNSTFASIVIQPPLFTNDSKLITLFDNTERYVVVIENIGYIPPNPIPPEEPVEPEPIPPKPLPPMNIDEAFDSDGRYIRPRVDFYLNGLKSEPVVINSNELLFIDVENISNYDTNIPMGSVSSNVFEFEIDNYDGRFSINGNGEYSSKLVKKVLVKSFLEIYLGEENGVEKWGEQQIGQYLTYSYSSESSEESIMVTSYDILYYISNLQSPLLPMYTNVTNKEALTRFFNSIKDQYKIDFEFDIVTNDSSKNDFVFFKGSTIQECLENFSKITAYDIFVDEIGIIRVKDSIFSPKEESVGIVDDTMNLSVLSNKLTSNEGCNTVRVEYNLATSPVIDEIENVLNVKELAISKGENKIEPLLFTNYPVSQITSIELINSNFSEITSYNISTNGINLTIFNESNNIDYVDVDIKGYIIDSSKRVHVEQNHASVLTHGEIPIKVEHYLQLTNVGVYSQELLRRVSKTNNVITVQCTGNPKYSLSKVVTINSPSNKIDNVEYKIISVEHSFEGGYSCNMKLRRM